MADITMCRNYQCPSRNQCYRFMAEPSPMWQSYTAMKLKQGEKKCDMFEPLPKGKPKSKKK